MKALIVGSEIALKGKNRSFFERTLADALRAAVPSARVTKLSSAFLLQSERAVEDVVERIQRVFGIAYVLIVEEVRARMDAPARAVETIGERAAALVAEVNPASFCIRAQRSDKRFPVTSQEMNVRIGHIVQEGCDVPVRLHDPALTVHVVVVEGRAFIGSRRSAGPGGLPTGSAGRVAGLLSGGIDSPVACWKMMKRGAVVDLIHFHSYPQTNKASLEKAKDLAKLIAAWQGPTKLFLVPLLPLQKHVLLAVDKSYLVLLYRRAMVRIAERIAHERGALGLVTGESLGQVASQTLENMAVVSSVATLPLYRPLIGDDKEEIITRARAIGTFETSTRPHEDCCSLFVPTHPATRATLAAIEREEKKVDLDRLCDAAYVGREEITVRG